MQQGIDRRGFVLAAGAATAGLVVRPARASRRRRNEPILPWDQLRPGVWAASADLPGGNVIAIASEGEAAVVDSKFASVAGALAADARALARREGGPLTLVNTHHHADHTSGNAAFKRAGASIVAHANATPRIAGQLERYRSDAEAAVDGAMDIDPDNQPLRERAEEQAAVAASLGRRDVVPLIALADASTLNVGAMAATLTHHGPGHTDNDLAVHLSDLDVLHAGDLVFNGLHPFFDTSAGVNARGWIERLRTLESLCGEDTVVVPGHGPIGGRGIVTAQREYIERLIEAVQAAQRAGRGKDETAQQTFGFMEGLGFDRIRPIAIGAVWDEIESE